MSRRSGGQRCYVDNAYNRQLGRVGKLLGTHVVSKSGSVSYSSETSSQRCYVDNAYNRQLGRVGKLLGTHVVSKGGSTSVGSCSVSYSSEPSSQRRYVDNAYNRQLGRVGKPLGTHVVSKSGSTSVGSCSVSYSSEPSSQRCYVDNAYNRQLGRVGKPLGTHVVSKSGSVSYSSEPSSQRCYVDNAYNRQLGRVGKPLGTHVVSKSGSTSAGSCSVSHSSEPSSQRCYVDNAYNRKLGLVGNPLGTRVFYSHGKARRSVRQQKIMEENTAHDLNKLLQRMEFADTSRPYYQSALDRLEREQVEESWKEIGVYPSTDISRLSHHIRWQKSNAIIPFAELELEKQAIGHGGFGEVYAGFWHKTPVAFKKLFHQRMSRKLLESFKRETTVLAALDHPNTVKMFGVVVEEGNVGIVMEYLPCSLFGAIFIDCVEFPDSKKREVVHQITSALMYLHTHERKIAHCDIKSENVLLDKEDNVKLGDFGLSAVKNTSQSSMVRATPGQGTPLYSAPEVLRGELLTMAQLFQADIYSLAVVVFEVVTGEEPFEHLDLNVRQLEANVGHGSLRPTSTVAMSKPVEQLLNQCWDGSASKRPTIEEFQAKWSNFTVLYEKS